MAISAQQHDVKPFFRFPHTPHIAWLGHGVPRDDKVLAAAEARAFLTGDVVIEEKLDGANLGISVDAEGSLLLQNRSHYLQRPFAGQFARLEPWLAEHQDRLFDALEPHIIVFGEWCAARHSLGYEKLPDWWVLFDVYDRQDGRFWSVTRRNEWAMTAGVACVTEVFRGRASLSWIQSSLQTTESAYRSGPPEGFVVRKEDANWLISRAKLVQRDFTQNIGAHWSRQALHWNRLAAS